MPDSFNFGFQSPLGGGFNASGGGTGLGDIINQVLQSGSQLGQSQIAANASMNNSANQLFGQVYGINQDWAKALQYNNLQDVLSQRNTDLQKYLGDQQATYGDLASQRNAQLQDLLSQRSTQLQDLMNDRNTTAQRYGSDQQRLATIGAATASAAPALLNAQNSAAQFNRVYGDFAPIMAGLMGGSGETLNPGDKTPQYTYQGAPAQTAQPAAPVAQSAPAPQPAAPAPAMSTGNPGPGQSPYRPSGQTYQDAGRAAMAAKMGGTAPSAQPSAPRMMSYQSAGGPGAFHGSVTRSPAAAGLKPTPAPSPAPAPAPAPVASGGGTPAPSQPAAPNYPTMKLQSAGPTYSPPPLPSNLGINPLQQRQILNSATSQIDRANQANTYRDMPNRYGVSGFSPTGQGFGADAGVANYRAAQAKANAAVQVPLQVAQFNAPLNAQLAQMGQDRYNQFQNRGIQRSGQALGFLSGLLK